MSDRVGDVLFSYEELTDLFQALADGTVTPRMEGLPPDARVVGVHHCWERRCLAVRFESGSLREAHGVDVIERIDAGLRFEHCAIPAEEGEPC